ncbi:MAG: hypothetical protein ACOYNS_16600 [Bacteroidota bacterium]
MKYHPPKLIPAQKRRLRIVAQTFNEIKALFTDRSITPVVDLRKLTRAESLVCRTCDFKTYYLGTLSDSYHCESFYFCPYCGQYYSNNEWYCSAQFFEMQHHLN